MAGHDRRLRGGREAPRGVPAEDLLDAVIARQRNLAAALNEVDPFYCYEVQIRSGRVREQAWTVTCTAPMPVAWMHYRQLDEGSYLLMRLPPRCAELRHTHHVHQAATTADIDPDRLSFTTTLRAVRRWITSAATATGTILADVIAEILEDQHERRDRVSPRVVKRSQAPYPSRKHTTQPTSATADYTIHILHPGPA